MEPIIWVFIILIYVVIGFLLSMYWYSPKLEEIDNEIGKRGSSGELGMMETALWICMMIFFWVLLAPYEKYTNFEHWYPENINPLEK
jgi:hypothetical protein